MATPLIVNQNANVTSKTSIGSHTSHVTDDAQDATPPNEPASCRGRTTTSKIEAAKPSCASQVGIDRPFRNSHEKIRLLTAK